MQRTWRKRLSRRPTAKITKAASRSSLSIARGIHFIFGPVVGVAAVTALWLAHIENQVLVVLQQFATLVTVIVNNQRASSASPAVLPPHQAPPSLLHKHSGSTVGPTGNVCTIMYRQEGQQPFSNGPGPSHRQPPPTQHPSHPNMQRTGFQFPRPTQLPDELESALSARGARDMDHRQIDHMNQNQGPASRMNQHGSYGSNPLPLPIDNHPDLRPGVDWSNFQPPVKLFASPLPNVSCQPQQHHRQLQQPPNSQAGPRVPNWAAPVCDSMSAQTRHPSSGGEGQNLYTPESAGSILASFGLSNEDLEVLSHYPDDQLTPDTLPFILRDIQINKSSNPVVSTSASSFSCSLHDMPPSSSSPLASQEVPSFLTVTQTAGKVIDYGHASRAKDGGETFKREPLSNERTVKMYPTTSITPSTPKAGKPGRLLTQSEGSDSTKHGDRDYRRTGRNSRRNTEFLTKSGPQDRDYRHDRTKAPSSESRSEASSRRSFSSSSASKTHGGSTKLPTSTMISDFSAVSPKVYPHTCSLCNTQCDQEQDWTEHVNTVSHTAACRDLRNRYPDWRSDAASQSWQHGSRGLWDRRDNSPSLSRSPSPGLLQGKPRRDSRTLRPHWRSGSPYRRPGPYHHTERRPRSEHHSGSHSPHRPSSRDHCLHRRDRLSPGGPPRSGLKRAHEDSSQSSYGSKQHPAKGPKAVTKPGTKTALKVPPVKKKKKVAAPASEDSQVTRRLVYLTGIPNDASEQEVTDLVCSFGKINNVILMPSSEEDGEKTSGQKASVCMMKAEDAVALSTSSNLSIREQIITASVAQKPEVEQPSNETSRNPEPDNRAAGNNSAEVNQTTSEKCLVLVSGLPDSGCSRRDVLDLFPSCVSLSDVILAKQLRKALVSVTDGGTVQEMMKVHSVTPARVKDTKVDLVLIQQNISLSTPVALYNLLMTSLHVLESPVRVGWSRLLVIRNVPDNPSGSKEVQQLVQRFGTVIKTLVLENMVICEMATATMALSVFKRFQTFPCIIHRNPLMFSRKPDLKASALAKVACLEALENTATSGRQTTVNEEEPSPVPSLPCREKGSDGDVENVTRTAAMAEDKASRPVSKRNGEEEAVCDIATFPGESPAGPAVTEATGMDHGGSEAAHQEVPAEPETEANADSTATPQEVPGPPIPKMTQAMVNALLEECRIQTAKNTAALPSGQQPRSPTVMARKAAELEKLCVKEVLEEEERKVKEIRQKQQVKEKSEKERRLWEKERAGRMKERSEKAWRERERRERKRGSDDLPRSRSSSKSEGHRQEKQRPTLEDGTQTEEEEEEEFPFDMSDFVTVDEVGEVSDLPTIALDTCDAHTHPEDQASPADASQSPAGGPAAGASPHEPTSVQNQVLCPAEAPEEYDLGEGSKAPGSLEAPGDPEAPEAPEESDLGEGYEAPGSLEAPGDPEAPEAPEESDLGGGSEAPGSLEAPGDPEAPEAPEEPDLGGGSEAPGSLEAPGDPEAPQEPDHGGGSEAPGSLEAPGDPEAPEAPQEPDHGGGSEAPGSLEAPSDPEAPEAHTTAEPGSAPSTPATPTKSSGSSTAEEEKGEEKPSPDHKEVKDGAAGEEKLQMSEDLVEISQCLPPFDPSRPVGLEFLVPKTGFFCKVCRRFFSGAKEAEMNHCRTIKHYENLQKHFLSKMASS